MDKKNSKNYSIKLFYSELIARWVVANPSFVAGVVPVAVAAPAVVVAAAAAPAVGAAAVAGLAVSVVVALAAGA